MQKDDPNEANILTLPRITQIKAQQVRVDMNHKIPAKLSTFFDLRANFTMFKINQKLDGITEEEESNPPKPTTAI